MENITARYEYRDLCRLTDRLPAFKPRELANVVWGIGALGHAKCPLLARLLDACLVCPKNSHLHERHRHVLPCSPSQHSSQVLDLLERVGSVCTMFPSHLGWRMLMQLQVCKVPVGRLSTLSFRPHRFNRASDWHLRYQLTPQR